ncbi:uncharacterized protein LOC117569650 isoform X2 [Drosophila albomicans]|uniref:Uncharacterized protein LOC117569650 isoform X2 n=1 Tax=Drosophila albomicans TaxID=7291 RepID=A0A6P8WSY7_DROAB|nr:uncharacterized protein LOC117569650 isoform X2 [Drosophila albomicans]
MLLKPYQLAIAIALFLACFSPEVSCFARNFGRPNATYYAPAQTYPGHNYTRPNIGFQQHYPAQPAYNSGPNPIYGNRPGNYSLHGGYRPRNNTNIFARLFKFW